MLTKEKGSDLTKNSCKLCAPLGASLVFKGIKGAIPLLHGSQGCATYIRRYLINHFKEPVDIASSSFGETTAIFGGQENLWQALNNIIAQYHPACIGIATTCLSETIGDDIPMILQQLAPRMQADNFPEIVHVSTPSYKGIHSDGFHDTVFALVKRFAAPGDQHNKIAVFPNFISCEDLRFLKDVFLDFGREIIVVPDYSTTLDGPPWQDYQHIPEGGTALDDIKSLPGCNSAFELGHSLARRKSAGQYLSEYFQVPLRRMGLPVGLKASDQFFQMLEDVSGQKTPQKYSGQRARLLDSYVDAHKYVFGKKAVVYGEDDFVTAVALFLMEIGMEPVLCASGSKCRVMKEVIENAAGEYGHKVRVGCGYDFADIEREMESLAVDILIGNSKGYSLARKKNLPLVRLGFPIHDRMGAAHILTLGYGGALHMFETITNTLLRTQQDRSSVGYPYL
jgi:nitrogenase molybdenum-iron protein NifN